MRSGTWLELRDRIFALIGRPVSHDPFGRPVFTSMLQARLVAEQKPPA